MGAVSNFEHISAAIRFGVANAREAEGEIVEAFQTSSSTVLVNRARRITMYRSIICIGGFSVLEATLQQLLRWKDAFISLDAHLRANTLNSLADRFLDYKDAINVLKHGAGRSYDRLLARKADLSFRVKDRGQYFFDEGNISEVAGLVDANELFAHQCADIIDEVVAALRKTTDETI